MIKYDILSFGFYKYYSKKSNYNWIHLLWKYSNRNKIIGQTIESIYRWVNFSHRPSPVHNLCFILNYCIHFIINNQKCWPSISPNASCLSPECATISHRPPPITSTDNNITITTTIITMRITQSISTNKLHGLSTTLYLLHTT